MAAAGEKEDVKERCPQVFVVDSQVLGVPGPRQVPVKLEAQRLYLIYLLLGVALLGVFIEAGLIYHLYNRPTVPLEIQTMEYQKEEKHSDHMSRSHDSNEISPGRNSVDEKISAAFLQKRNGGLLWTSDVFLTFVKGLELKNNSLYCKQEGYYFIFSKICHQDSCSFLQHQVMYVTKKYSDIPMALMQSSRNCNSSKNQSTSQRSHSYLGGVFHLSKGDRVYVQVNDPSRVFGEVSENFFGAFKIQ